MITVAELAKEFNISVQTVYRTLNTVKQCETECLTEKIKGVSYFTEFGERVIRERLTPIKQNEGDSLTEFNSVKQAENEEILFLREQNKTLLQELEKEREHNRTALDTEREHSRKQADKIADLADKLTELTRNSQVLLKQEQDKNIPLLTGEQAEPQTIYTGEPSPRETKEGFFKRFFNKK